VLSYHIKHFCSIGPNGLSRGSLNPDGSSAVPTITGSLFDQKLIPNNFVAVSFEPTTLTSQMMGELTFGGIDITKVIESPTAL
jgi:hypothetical protein